MTSPLPRWTLAKIDRSAADAPPIPILFVEGDVCLNDAAAALSCLNITYLARKAGGARDRADLLAPLKARLPRHLKRRHKLKTLTRAQVEGLKAAKRCPRRGIKPEALNALLAVWPPEQLKIPEEPPSPSQAGLEPPTPAPVITRKLNLEGIVGAVQWIGMRATLTTLLTTILPVQALTRRLLWYDLLIGDRWGLAAECSPAPSWYKAPGGDEPPPPLTEQLITATGVRGLADMMTSTPNRSAAALAALKEILKPDVWATPEAPLKPPPRTRPTSRPATLSFPATTAGDRMRVAHTAELELIRHLIALEGVVCVPLYGAVGVQKGKGAPMVWAGGEGLIAPDLLIFHTDNPDPLFIDIKAKSRPVWSDTHGEWFHGLNGGSVQDALALTEKTGIPTLIILKEKDDGSGGSSAPHWLEVDLGRAIKHAVWRPQYPGTTRDRNFSAAGVYMIPRRLFVPCRYVEPPAPVAAAVEVDHLTEATIPF